MPVHIEPPKDAALIRERVAASVGQTFGVDPTLSLPFPIREADLKSLANGRLELIWSSRWRCLAGVEEPTAAVDVIHEAGHYSVVSINRGELASRFNQALMLADKELSERDYELSEVEIPGLHLALARLVDSLDGHELLIPVLPLQGASTPIVLMEAYSPEELIAALQPEAQRALEARWEWP